VGTVRRTAVFLLLALPSLSLAGGVPAAGRRAIVAVQAGDVPRWDWPVEVDAGR